MVARVPETTIDLCPIELVLLAVFDNGLSTDSIVPIWNKM
jgi:hypothetical protein